MLRVQPGTANHRAALLTYVLMSASFSGLHLICSPGTTARDVPVVIHQMMKLDSAIARPSVLPWSSRALSNATIKLKGRPVTLLVPVAITFA